MKIMIVDKKRSKRGGKVIRIMPLLPQTLNALEQLRDFRRVQGEPVGENDYIFPELWRTLGVMPCSNPFIEKRFRRQLKPFGLIFKDTVGAPRRTASNWWREKVGEFWENMFLGHSRTVARSDYYDPYSIPASIINQIKAPTDEQAAV